MNFYNACGVIYGSVLGMHKMIIKIKFLKTAPFLLSEYVVKWDNFVENNFFKN